MKARVKYEWMGYNQDNILVPCKFEEDIILSDEIGFDKNTYDGWYVSDEDLNKDGIYTKYWHHYCSDYKRGDLNEFDVTKCRKIIECSFLRK